MEKITSFLLFIAACVFVDAYEKPPKMEAAVWEELQNYFLPEDHELKPRLDKLFKSRKILKSEHSLYDAGFDILAHNPRNDLIVAKHYQFPGYVFKIFPDRCAMDRDWYYFRKRVRGARVIAAAIRRHRWTDQFFAPKKWIYPLPVTSYPGYTGYPKKHFILIAQEVKRIKSSSKHRKLWRSELITPQLLTRLHTLIQENGMADSVFIDNIPLCEDGRIAFIDTEYYHNWGIPYARLLPYLSKPMQAHWQSLH